MNILDQEDVLGHELKLLDLPGKALSSFYVYDPEETEFHTPTQTISSQLQRQLRIKNVRFCGEKVNSEFHMLACVLMKIFFKGQKRTDLLQKLKCTLYSSQIEMDKINGSPEHGLENKVMKKILVQFFQVMQYSAGECENILDKYPIVLEILALFFRTILTHLNIPGASFYLKQLDPMETIPILLDYFDISYHESKEAYIIYEDNIVIKIDQNSSRCYFGDMGGESEKEEEEDDNCIFNFEGKFDSSELEADELERKDYAPTPCFGEMNEEELNFNSKFRKNSLNENRMKPLTCEERVAGTMIKEANEEEEQDEKRRNSVQFRRKSEDICAKKIYYDFEGHHDLDAIESPKISSPAEDLDLQIQLNNIFNPKKINFQNKNPESHECRKEQRLEESTSKSDILKKSWNQDKATEKKINSLFFQRSNTEADHQSIDSSNSCTCTESKIKKNEFTSKIIDISFVPDLFKKKESPIISMKKHKLKYSSTKTRNPPHKVPAFLLKKKTSKDDQALRNTAPITDQPGTFMNPHPFQKPSGIKVNFTYGEKNQHFNTEPPKFEYPKAREMWSHAADRRLLNLERPTSYY